MRLRGAEALRLQSSPVWMRCRMPEEILKIAWRSELEHCAARKSVVAGESSFVVNDPGITRISNCGALANEFCKKSASVLPGLIGDER